MSKKLTIMDIRTDRDKLRELTMMVHKLPGNATRQDIEFIAKRLGCTFAAARSLIKHTWRVGEIRPYIPRKPKTDPLFD